MQLASTLRSTPVCLSRASQCRATSRRAPQPRRCASAAAARRQQWRRAAAAPNGTDPAAVDEAAVDEESEGLLPEEDEQIPGTWQDAMSTDAPLGKAVKGACKELGTLGELERQTLEEAEGLLKKLGFTGNLFAAPPPQPQELEQQGEDGKGESGAP